MIYSGRAVKIDQAQGHLTRVSSLFVSSAFLLNPLKSFFPAIHLFNSALPSDFVPSVSSRRDSLIILPAWSLTRFTRTAHGLLVASVCLCVNPLPSHPPPPPPPASKTSRQSSKSRSRQLDPSDLRASARFREFALVPLRFTVGPRVASQEDYCRPCQREGGREARRQGRGSS